MQVGKVAPPLVQVEAVAREELIRHREAHVPDREVVHEPAVGAVEERRCDQGLRFPQSERPDEVVERQAGVDDLVHEDHVAAGDLGMSAVRKYDCEAWLPSQERWLELTSTSNCTDFQARRLGVRTRTDAGLESVATLNGTLCAVGRTIAVLLEVHQRVDGSVHVPAALQPLLGGRTEFTPV